MKRKNTVAAIIWKTLGSCRLISFGVILTVAGAVVASLLPPLVLAVIIDRLTGGEMIAWHTVLLYFGLIAMTGVMETSRESLLTVLGQKITHALRTGLSAKLNALPADTLNQQEPGAVVSRFVGDVDTVENLFASGIISMFADVCKIISILVIIFNENKGLTILLCLVMPLIFLFTRHVQKNMLAAHIANRAAVSRVSSHVPETIRCIRTIHTLNKEQFMEDSYERYIGESYQAVEKTNFYDAIYSPVILICNAVVVAVVMLLSASGNAAVLRLFGMSVGTSVAVVNYIAQIFSPIESLGMEIQTIQSAVAGVHRINEFLAQEERWSTEPAPEYDHSAPCLELQNVSFGYDEQTILSGLSFCIKAGEQVTLAGRTGAGKSTVFRLLLGLYRVQQGSVKIYGVDAAQLPDSARRKIFGYVEQSFHMVPGTVRDQITLYDRSITEEMIVRAAKLTGLHDTISQLEKGYNTPCTDSILSQGQWQLLSIARAVAAEPEILLLDEITANLDAATEARVLEAISNVSVNRTVVSISHRIYQHTGGRLIAIGTQPEAAGTA